VIFVLFRVVKCPELFKQWVNCLGVFVWLLLLCRGVIFGRSEEMNMVQLFVQYDAAHDTIEELGNIGVLQFIDVSIEYLEEQ
jgi:hypothetical protein